eukprot:378302-Rhodomonas_salina.5
MILTYGTHIADAVRYTIPSSDIAYTVRYVNLDTCVACGFPHASLLCDVRYWYSYPYEPAMRCPPTRCYAMSSTDIADGGVSPRVATRCPGLTQRMVVSAYGVLRGVRY